MTQTNTESRRQFLQWLSASPLAASPALSAIAAETPSKLPDPMQWAPANLLELIKTPRDAINVFDFEPVARVNVPPAHFGYLASGIDDETTLRANREAFTRIKLRPRRLNDVSKVDPSIELLGAKWETPIIVAPTGGNKAFHADGEIAVARACKAKSHLNVLSTSGNTSIEDMIAAKGGPVWSACSNCCAPRWWRACSRWACATGKSSRRRLCARVERASQRRSQSRSWDTLR